MEKQVEFNKRVWFSLSKCSRDRAIFLEGVEFGAFGYGTLVVWKIFQEITRRKRY